MLNIQCSMLIMEKQIALHIVIEDAPPGVEFGLQNGKGNDYETVQLQRSGNGNLNFKCNVTLRENSKSTLDFFGPFVQGPAEQRFIYVDIGTCAGQKNTEVSRRMKIPLHTIHKSTLSKLMLSNRPILETTIAGTGKDGGPTCGTVKATTWRLV